MLKIVLGAPSFSSPILGLHGALQVEARRLATRLEAAKRRSIVQVVEVLEVADGNSLRPNAAD